MKQQLRQKDELRNTSTESTKEAMIFRKRAELAEDAAKSSRDKANQLEDVSIVHGLSRSSCSLHDETDLQSVRLMEAELSVLKEEHSNLASIHVIDVTLTMRETIL